MSDKKYDFSAFDKEKSYDFSAFDRSPASEEDPGTLSDALRASVRGATFDFNDELAGAAQAPTGAVKTLLNKLGTSYKDQDTTDYESSRDATRALDKAAEERSPYASFAGNLAGGIVPALLTGGLGTAAKAATTTGKILGAAKVGGALGAATGLGASEGETLGSNLEDVKNSAIGGALIGGGLQGLGSAVKGLSNLGKTRLAKESTDAFKLGSKGVDLYSSEGYTNAEKAARDSAEKLGSVLEESRAKVGGKIGSIKNNLIEEGKQVNLSEDVDKIKSVIEKLNKSDNPSAAQDAKLLQSYLDNLLLGKEQEVPIQYSKFTPGKEIKSTPSAMETLQAQAAKEKASASALGQDLKTDIIPSEDDQGNKLLTLLKRSDENIGASERALPVFDESGNQVSTDLILGDTAENFKTKASAKTIFDKPAVEGGFSPSERGPLVTETKKLRLGGLTPEETPFAKGQDIKGTLNDFTGIGGKTPTLGTQEAINEVKQVGKSVNDKLTQVPELADTNKKYASVMQAMDAIGLSSDDFVKDPITGKMKLDPSSKQKLTGLVKRVERDTDAGGNSLEKFNRAMELLKSADPEAAASIASEVQQSSNILDLAQKAQGLGLLNRSTWLKAAPIKVGNIAGLATKDVAQGLTAHTPESLKSLASTVYSKGSPAASKLAMELIEASKKDDVGRNATMFALQQNPSYRELLKSDKE